jgi:hypothetical protein
LSAKAKHASLFVSGKEKKFFESPTPDPGTGSSKKSVASSTGNRGQFYIEFTTVTYDCRKLSLTYTIGTCILVTVIYFFY